MSRYDRGHVFMVMLCLNKPRPRETSGLTGEQSFESSTIIIIGWALKENCIILYMLWSPHGIKKLGGMQSPTLNPTAPANMSDVLFLFLSKIRIHTRPKPSRDILQIYRARSGTGGASFERRAHCLFLPFPLDHKRPRWQIFNK